MNLPLLPNVPWWGQDKSWHFLTGLPGGATVALVVRYFWASPWSVLGWGVLAGAAVGTAKEVWDWWRNRQAVKAGLPPPHSVEVWDAVATTLGFTVGAGFIVSVF